MYVETGFCFPTVLCNPFCLPISVVLPNCHCFSGNILASSPSHISWENAGLYGVKAVTGLIACSHVGIWIRGIGWISSKALSSLHHTWVLHQGLSHSGTPPLCFLPSTAPASLFVLISFGKEQCRAEGERKSRISMVPYVNVLAACPHLLSLQA